MRSIYRFISRGILGCALCFIHAGCTQIDDNRIPSVPVSINLADAGLWNVYGVSGFGVWRTFERDLGLPQGFHYTGTTYTGYGGILLIGGMDQFNSDTDTPLAYDLSCPVECRRDVRVRIDEKTLDAVCPVCDSHYNVVMQGGAATSGKAYSHKPRYGLRRYECIPAQLGGYMIRD